jgi:hypothetical protein
MSMGTGAAYSTSKKQKLNTKSSTEAELVGIDDVLPQAIWTKYFLEAQGYGTDTILNQDNQSTIKLAETGEHPAEKERVILTSGTFLLPIELLARKSQYSIVPRRKWSPTILPNHCRENYFINSVTRFLVWSPWKLSSGTTGVCYIKSQKRSHMGLGLYPVKPVPYVGCARKYVPRYPSAYGPTNPRRVAGRGLRW